MKEHRRYKGLDQRVADRRQRDREAMLVAQDKADERVEEMRLQAEADALEGKVANLQDTVVPPTPEWLKKGETVPYTPRGRDGTVKAVKTVRRRMFDAVKHLQSRGGLDDQQAFACRWLRDVHEAAQIDQSAGIASYGETIRGDKIYGHLPSTEWAAQARRDYRAAYGSLPLGTGPALVAVAIDNLSVEDAARSIKRRKGITRLMVSDAATALAGWLKARAEPTRNAR